MCQIIKASDHEELLLAIAKHMLSKHWKLQVGQVDDKDWGQYFEPWACEDQVASSQRIKRPLISGASPDVVSEQIKV